MTGRKPASAMPDDVVARLLRATRPGEVLVGGQSLAFWAQRYGLAVPVGFAAISHDTDFLADARGGKAAVERFASVLRGEALFPNRRALTSLVGMAVVDVSDDEYLNVDVIHTVMGLGSAEIRRWAVRFEHDGASYEVMHPLHVLRSRLTNLCKIAEKRNDKGRMQLGLGIDVAREFLRSQAAALPADALATRSPIQRYVREIEQMAVEDAGRKIAKRDGLHVADAIDPALIPAGLFWTKRWPTLRTLMSPAYAARFSPPPTTLTVEDAPVPSRARRRQPTSGGARRPR